MFDFELPCDWSVNRRPHNNNNGTNGGGGGDNNDVRDSAKHAKKEEGEKPKCKTTTAAATKSDKPAAIIITTSSSSASEGKGQQNKVVKKSKREECNNKRDDNNDNNGGAGGNKKNKKGGNNNNDEEGGKQKIAKSKANDGGDDDGGGGNDEVPEAGSGDGGGGDTTDKDKDASSSVSEPKIILGNVLGPRSNFKSDSVEEEEDDDDHDHDDDDKDEEKEEQIPSKKSTIQQPWSGKVKMLVIKHLHNANQMGEIKTSKKRPRESYIDTESLLSKLPYKKMLSDMFGGNLRGNLQTSIIPYVTRAYEEAFMHEPTNSSERECARGKQCECMFIDRLQPFTAVEFLLPGEQAPSTPHLCVLCCRAITQQLYYDVVFDKCEFPGTIQRFGNIHSEPGEYALDAMLIAASTAPVHIMPLPIVSHQRNRYTVHVMGGIKRLKQSRVYFHRTPSCSADNGQ